MAIAAVLTWAAHSSIAVVVLVIFAYWELVRAEEPLVPLRLLAHRIVGVSGGTTFLVGAVFFPLATFISLVVGEALTPHGGDATMSVRNVLYALVLPLVVGAALGGQLLTRITYRIQVVVGIAIAIGGLLFLREITSTTALWTLAFGFLPVGGVVVPLIPLGFGIGLTFPVFLLAVQSAVETKDVGEASGLIQFLQSLGGSIGLSVLGSYATTRFNQLDPLPEAACNIPSNTPPPACIPYDLSFASSLITAYVEAFTIMLGLLVAALVVALFFRGRFLKQVVPAEAPSLD